MTLVVLFHPPSLTNKEDIISRLRKYFQVKTVAVERDYGTIRMNEGQKTICEVNFQPDLPITDVMTMVWVKWKMTTGAKWRG